MKDNYGNKLTLIELQKRADKIQKFLSYTTEPFNDWMYDGQILYIYLNDKLMEEYNNIELSKFIDQFN